MGGGCDSSCSLGGAPVSLVLLLYSLELFFSFSSFHGIDLIIVNCRFRTCNFWYFIRTASPPSPVIPSLPSDPHNFDSPLYLDLYIVPFFERSTQLLHDLCLQILLISVNINGDPSSFTSQTHCPPLRSLEKSLGRIELGPTEIVSKIAGNLFSTHSWVKQEFKTIEIGGGGWLWRRGPPWKLSPASKWEWESGLGSGDESVMAGGAGNGPAPLQLRADFWVRSSCSSWKEDKTCAREMRSGVRTLHLAGAIHYPHTPLISAAFHIIAQPPSPTPLLKHKSHGSSAQNEHFRSWFSKYKTLRRASF